MLQEIKGDIWMYRDKECPNAWIAITTNGFVKKDGSLVMGRGIAKEAIERHTGLSIAFGRLIKELGNRICIHPTLKLITFPVKHNWWEKADLDLIEKSAKDLAAWIERDKAGTATILLPRPGCGNGRLAWKDVKPIIQKHLDPYDVRVFTK